MVKQLDVDKIYDSILPKQLIPFVNKDKNEKQIDLNNHLFAQLERLSDEDITEQKLHQEIERTKAITLMAREIIGNGKLILDGQRAVQQTVFYIILLMFD